MNKLTVNSIALAAALVAGCATYDDSTCGNCSCGDDCKCAKIPNTLTCREKAEGWQMLWDGGNAMPGWVGEKEKFKAFPKKGWQMKDGVLTVLPSAYIDDKGKWQPLKGDKCLGGGGSIVTEKKYGDFIFKCDFRLTPKANSGIKYFYDETLHQSTTLEYQILDSGHPDSGNGRDGNRRVASLYDMIPARAEKHLKPCGEWNEAMIVSKGNHVEHWLNGVKVLEFDRGSESFRAAVAASKYPKYATKGFRWGETKVGRIHIQDHADSTVSYRNIKIKEL